VEKEKKISYTSPASKPLHDYDIAGPTDATDRRAPEMLVPKYIPVHTVPYHTTQSSQRLRENLQSYLVLQDILVFKIFHLSKSTQSSTECLMFTSVVHCKRRLPPGDSGSQYHITSHSKAAFLLPSTKYIF